MLFKRGSFATHKSRIRFGPGGLSSQSQSGGRSHGPPEALFYFRMAEYGLPAPGRLDQIHAKGRGHLKVLFSVSMCISITTTRASTDLRREEARVPRRPLRRARMASTTRGHSIQRATLFHFKRRAAATPTRLSTTPHNRGTPFLPRTFNPPFTVPRFTPTTVPAAPTTTITTTASVST